jgi:hypothetical protein
MHKHHSAKTGSSPTNPKRRRPDCHGKSSHGRLKKMNKPNSMRDAPTPATHIERKDVVYMT